MTERMKEIQKMIETVMKKRDLNERSAIEYMLGVATGRLAALWRYDKSLPDGKTTKGILAVSGRKKRAEKVARISTLVAASAAEEVSKKASKPAIKRKSSKKRKVKSEGESAEISGE